eukprot:68648_1
MQLRLASANKPFLERIRSIINEHCLYSTLNSGRIYGQSSNCFELIYTDKAMCNDIGQWFYDSKHVEGFIMSQKYNRYLLLKQLFIYHKLSIKERIEIIVPFLENEQLKKLQTLQKLTSMCNKEIPVPEHFRFRKKFVGFSTAAISS